MIWRRALCAIALMAATTAGWACSDDDGTSGGGGGASCPKDNPECKEIATVEAGAQAVVKRKCVQCHGDDMSGSTTALVGIPPTPQGEPVELYPPNLTADPETGVAPPEMGGKWTDDALALAIRTGIDEESQALCPQMTHFANMSDFEVYSIVKYLRHIPPVKKQVPRSVCPPMKTKEQQSLPR
jgi:mono/diheme cytochrome c family protein